MTPRMAETWDEQESEGLLQNGNDSTQRERPPSLLYPAIYLLVLVLTSISTGLLTFRFTTEANHITDSPNRPLYKDLDRASIHKVNFSAFSLGHSQYTAPASINVDRAWRELGVECESQHIFMSKLSLKVRRPCIFGTNRPSISIRNLG